MTRDHQIIVSTALLQAAKSDSELAFAIGHSFAHFALEHDRSAVRDYIYSKAFWPAAKWLLPPLGLSLSALVFSKQWMIGVVGLTVGVIVVKTPMVPDRWKRVTREGLADETSLLFLALAGYHLEEAGRIVPFMAKNLCNVQVEGEGCIVCGQAGNLTVVSALMFTDSIQAIG